LTEQSSNTVNDSTAYTTNYSVSGEPYYHLHYLLNSENLLEIESYSQQEFKQNGGQFEVLLKRSAFPVASPNCHSNLILRMPWVPPGSDLSAKYDLYQNILAVHSQRLDTVTVFIELNPYVQENEQGITLTQCNVFFRHANSQYIAHTQSVN
jgi:hypothetical protein